MIANNYPKLHNAMWPGLVGKGEPDSEPCIDFDTMLDLTAKAEVDGARFDGVDLFLYQPHVDIDLSDDGIKALAEKVASKGLVVGSVVAPVWFDASAMGDERERAAWLEHVRKSIRIAAALRELGIRQHGVVRIDSAASVADWAADPEKNTKLIARTFREAGNIARDAGERLAAEGEVCWGGMHSWKNTLRLLEETDMPEVVGFQADMSHTLLFALGVNAEEDRIVPRDFHWEPDVFHSAMKTLTDALRPWTIDFHVAQNDGSVFGSGTHEQTGRHCLATDPRGKLNIPRDSGYWLRDGEGALTKATQHICWDGCMFPNEILLKQQTWNDVLSAMIEVRANHGWGGEEAAQTSASSSTVDNPLPRKV